MKTYNEFINESQLNEDADEIRRVQFNAKKLGFEVTPISKTGSTSYKVGDYTFGSKGQGQWQIVNKAGKEVDYLFNKKVGDVVKLMDEYRSK